MKKNLFIGRLSFNDSPCAGEVVKNRMLVERLRQVMPKGVVCIDAIPYSRRIFLPILYMVLFVKLLFNNYERIIVSTHDTLANRIINFLGKIGKEKTIIYWVIGGGVSKKINNNELKSDYYMNLLHIIVEDFDIENHFRSMGYSNVSTLPNFKPIFAIEKNNKERVGNRFVFVSRITPLKGCDIILSAIKQLNRKGLFFSVDFYGPIEKDYPFEEYIIDIPNVSYKGIMSLKTKVDYEVLSKYTALLFPTYYPNEGFPGTLIDGFIAGLPIITTNWRYNHHIVEDNSTGWLLPIQDSEALANVMEGVINNKYDLFSVSDACIKAALKYDTQSILSEQVLSKYFTI